MPIYETLGLIHAIEEQEQKSLHMSQAMATDLCSGIAHSRYDMSCLKPLSMMGLSPLYFPGMLLGIIIPVILIYLLGLSILLSC